MYSTSTKLPHDYRPDSRAASCVVTGQLRSARLGTGVLDTAVYGPVTEESERVKPPSSTPNICIPIHLDAFALSPDCADGISKLAPYTQPNYVALRLDSHLIQNDVLDHVDFHLAASAATNPRLSDVGSEKHPLKLSRLGIHLHWTIPRFYRTATAAAQQSNRPTEDDSSKKDESQPTFPAIPNRWLVVRHLQSCEPAGVLPTFQGFIIESDVVRKITEITDPAIDLQSDVSPFVSYTGQPSDSAALKNQAEIFLGQKFDLPGWREDGSRNHTRLTVMNSSNPLFPDYALHNTNVLSMIDSFSYMKDGKTLSYCTKAAAHYYVIGWHSDRKDDPFTNITADSNLGAKLSSLMLQLDIEPKHEPDDNKLSGSVRSLSHGAIYNVSYNRAKKPPSTADETAKNFTANIDMEPLSLGTTTLDSILTFLKAHRNDSGAIFKFEKAKSVVNDILQLSSLLYASGDDYESRAQAEDLIVQRNYAKVDGGSYWTFNEQAPKGGAPIVPSPTIQAKMRDLNASQVKLDATIRKLRSVQWDLFAEWWKFVSRSFVTPKALSDATPDLQKRVDQLKKECAELLAMQDALAKSVKSVSDSMAVKKASSTPYYSRIDPTLCIAGMDSGRPKDFMDLLKVQETHQLPQNTTAVDAMFKNAAGQNIPLPFPTDNKLADTAKRILAQCLTNKPQKPDEKPDLAVTTGYRNWGNQNPFIPLFMEWEAVYYHVDNPKHDAWSVDVRASQENPRSRQVRYAPVNVLRNDPSAQKDTRTLSGRVLVLPQPTFNLEATVKQVLDGTSPDMKPPQGQIDELLANIRNMQFISARLSGLTNHLLTRFEGAHVKPNVRDQGQTVIPLKAAVDAGSSIHIDRSTLRLIDAQTALTPYGTSNDFATGNFPFKPVTQGQLIFTKLNIVDKFGQAVCVPTPRPRRRAPLDKPSAGIYPCLSDYLTPDVRNGMLNTIFDIPGAAIGSSNPGADGAGAGKWPLCQYMQLTPAINQDARINTSFVVREEDDKAPSPWRAVSDYEQPIWGWIVVNYADRGLQFFLKDGTFYQEVRLGGANGTNTSVKYIPFKPPPMPNTNDPANKQLDELIALFNRDPAYLQAFADMINGAIKTMPFPPSDYAAFANAIVGKPLALVNLGMSLELASPAIIAQNTLGKAKHRDDPAFANNPDIGAGYQADLESYSFPVKIGAATRSFDGVVGYFDSDNSSPSSSPRGKTDWNTLYTYFMPPEKDMSPSLANLIKPIEPATFPSLNPYYIHPNRLPTGVDMARAAAAKWTVKSVLVDPYTPLHVYSPILPTATHKLPSWTVESALKKMSAFFRLGPMLLTDDVPSSVPKPLVLPTPPAPTVSPAAGTGAGPVPPATVPPVMPAVPSVRLPISGRKGTWKWLQPYDVANKKDAEFATYEVEEDQGQNKFAPGPYTFVEGYLLLAGQDLAGLSTGGK
ncbi:hypothetical protein B0H66DRAFT_579087 [Apodospora peruviana]|uniref:Uncharacterized protein n=1 Tax=Apodospora peruviana TaxID=516989 RepID=A0AAE0MEF5_9PEZI|nr:hypothetical protein B0H66DRAFT_579087 [Apodospora peruviana]